jgi:hypothetical protein
MQYVPNAYNKEKGIDRDKWHKEQKRTAEEHQLRDIMPDKILPVDAHNQRSEVLQEEIS